MAGKHLNTEEFNLAVYQIVKTIPPGKVITCGQRKLIAQSGQIAKLTGFPTQTYRVRGTVDFISHTSPPVPWHRVVATSGAISIHGPNAQQRLLETEGIEVTIGAVGESRVLVEKWGWFPEVDDVRLGTKHELKADQEWGA